MGAMSGASASPTAGIAPPSAVPLPIPRDQYAADMASNYQRNMPFVKPGASDFQTQLSPQQEDQFRRWVQKNNVPFNPNSKGPTDYDMRGYWKASQDPSQWAQLQKSGAIPSDIQPAGTRVDPNDGKPHFPDYWKTPYHETFSNESQWANPKTAPRWNNKDQLVTPDGKVLFDDRKQNKKKGRTILDAPLAGQ